MRFGTLFLALLAWSEFASAQKWIALDTPPQFNVGVALQLTDGTILVQEFGTSHWWKLTPTNEGVYHSGTLTQVASFPASMNYAPLYFASAVLPDGRVIVEGGEYNNGVEDRTTKGAIYDPVKDIWTPVAPPKGWTGIGDAESVVLPDGTFMLANCCANEAALLDPTTLTWKILTPANGYFGKYDSNNEEGWTLLPNGKVLTIDTYIGVNDPRGTNSEVYDPATGSWSSAGSTVAQLWDSHPKPGCRGGSANETGNAVLRPDGTVFATGANTCGGAGHTAIYDTTSGTWSAGPDLPNHNDVADGPAALLPNGHVLIDTNPGYGNSPSTLYEFDGTQYLTIPQPDGLNPSNTEGASLLITAAGTVLLTHLGYPQMWFYIPKGKYDPSWQPQICSSCYPANAYVGNTYTVSGTQFNGLSQGSSFGDDAQSATNYPLVLITNNATGHKFFARTQNHSTMAVATGNQPVSTEFTILPGTESGDSTMVVIANGIPSNTVGITILGATPGK
jgi:hypothetical protein